MSQLIPFQPLPLSDQQGSSFPMGSGMRPGQAEDDVSLSTLVGVFRRQWLLILFSFVVGVLGANAITRMTAPIYRASTTLYFADRQGSVPALDILNQMETGNNEVATEMEVMRSRALAETVVDSLGMQASVVEPTGAVTSSYVRVIRADPLAANAVLQFAPRGNNQFEVTDVDSNTRLGVATAGSPFSFGKVTMVLEPRSERFRLRIRPRVLAVDGLLARLNVSRPNRAASVVQVSYTGTDRIQTRDVPDVLANTYLRWRS